MIPKDSLVAVGETHKPHGVRGELSATFDDRELDPAGLRCLIMEMDGLPVPFFLESARRRGATSWLLKFEGADDENAAARLSRREIFALTEDVPYPADDEGVYLHDLVGYTVFDDNDTVVGTVADIDDSTANTLLIINRPGTSGSGTMVPFSDDLLLWLDTSRRALGLDIPAGVLDLND